MTPPPGPKTTDQRQAQTIALAIIDKLETMAEQASADGRSTVGSGVSLAIEGKMLISATPIDWSLLLDWNRRACDWLMRNRQVKP
jgi:hypothetical protein